MDRIRHEAREHVGGAETFDVVGGRLFALLLAEGLREDRNVLDVGCGCLRVGKLLIAFLEAGRYCGVEPEHWVLDAGIAHEAGPGLIADKAARFDGNPYYDFGGFEQRFDVAFAGSVLSHTYVDEATALLLGVRRVLVPDGAFHATYIEEGSELAASRPMPNGCERNGWAAAGLTYSRGQIEELADTAGFGAAFGTSVEMSVHPLGQRWVTFRIAGGGDHGD